MNRLERISLAKKSLLGVSIGDAFGESFFGLRESIESHIKNRTIPESSWEFTDDTVMSIAVFNQLERNGTIVQSELARAFASNHSVDVNRGYGATARRVLRDIEAGKDWKHVSQSVFEGMGSMGNGAAMRSSVIGAFFYDDLNRVRKESTKSAEITHYNIEGITGAIAVSLASALTTQIGLGLLQIGPLEFLERIVSLLPDSDTRAKINKAIRIPSSYHIDTLRSILGNGIHMLAQDTVPFALWCSAHYQHQFEEAIWRAVSILGDRDTICAIVGGITIMSCDENSIPRTWTSSVESVDDCPFVF